MIGPDVLISEHAKAYVRRPRTRTNAVGALHKLLRNPAIIAR
jgi:hypothetical protein